MEHVCYWCLLADTEVDNYNRLQRLAVERRAMFHMAESGLRTRTEFSKSLGMQAFPVGMNNADFVQVSHRIEPVSFTR